MGSRAYNIGKGGTDKPVFGLTRVWVKLMEPDTGMLEDSPARDTQTRVPGAPRLACP